MAIGSILWFACWGYVGKIIADSRNRNQVEAIIVCGILGPVGAVIELLLPAGEIPQ